MGLGLRLARVPGGRVLPMPTRENRPLEHPEARSPRGGCWILQPLSPSGMAAGHALMDDAESNDMGTFLTGERVERRLAAVLAADVAGYSRLMGHDEERTLAPMQA